MKGVASLSCCLQKEEAQVEIDTVCRESVRWLDAEYVAQGLGVQCLRQHVVDLQFAVDDVVLVIGGDDAEGCVRLLVLSRIL